MTGSLKLHVRRQELESSPIKCRRIDFSSSADDQDVHYFCHVSGRKYFISACKSNGIRIGCGDMVSVSVTSNDQKDESSLSYCQVAAIWKNDNNKDGSNEFTVAGRWFEPLPNLHKYFTKTTNR